jgi:hypothetical protein
MWQSFIVAVLVIAATIYAARRLGPRRWRRKARGAAAGAAAGGVDASACGCGKDQGGCH